MRSVWRIFGLLRPFRVVTNLWSSTDLKNTNTCTTFLIRCVDRRYSITGVRQRLPEAYDHACPGASLWFVNRESTQHEVCDAIRCLQRVGIPINTIIIADHWDTECRHGCRAYEDDNSRARHENNLRKAAQILSCEFPEMTVRLFLHDIDSHKVVEVSMGEPVSVSSAEHALA